MVSEVRFNSKGQEIMRNDKPGYLAEIWPKDSEMPYNDEEPEQEMPEPRKQYAPRNWDD